MISLLFAAFAVASINAQKQTGTVYVGRNNTLTFSAGVYDSKGVAMCQYENTTAANGWGQLSVVTNAAHDNALQSRAGGICEGAYVDRVDRVFSLGVLVCVLVVFFVEKRFSFAAPTLLLLTSVATRRRLTVEAIDATIVNSGFPLKLSAKVERFLLKNFEWIDDQIRTNKRDDYWQQVAAVKEQITGLTQGYNMVSRTPITEFTMWMLSADSGESRQAVLSR